MSRAKKKTVKRRTDKQRLDFLLATGFPLSMRLGVAPDPRSNTVMWIKISRAGIDSVMDLPPAVSQPESRPSGTKQ